MATSRGQTPPVNLKERIAALQQCNVSPNTHQSAQAVPRGLPSPGSGGLRDKIAKFEEKGGTPVPRGSFTMGVPQLAENAPPKKRGELYGNRVPGLGRPGGPPASRSGSPLPSTDEPGPRKRCISTGTGLSNPSSNFSTDEPVPALPNSLTPRRNSLAVNFGSGRRALTNEEEEGIDASSPSSVVPEKPPEIVEERSFTCPAAETTAVGQPSQPSRPSPVEEPMPAPAPKTPFPLSDATRNVNVSQSSTVERGSKDELSEYESAPQSAVSQPSPLLPKSSVSVDTPLAPTKPVEEAVVSPPTGPKVTKSVTSSRGNHVTISVPGPTVSVPLSIPTPTLATSLEAGKSTFKAVVHRKIAEPPLVSPPSNLFPPLAVPQLTKPRKSVGDGGGGGNVIEVPPSPGHGDLAVLLEDAALLALRLTEGDSTGLKAKELLPTTPTPTSSTFQMDARHASASTLTEHVHVPCTDSGSLSARSMSIPSIREPLIDGEIPEGEETDGRSLASTTFSQRSPSHRKYLTNIYRLTGRRSSSYMPGTYPRDSMSMSSEDSSPVTTPSDNGKRKGFGIAWPSASPKKGGMNVSRSSSFADKIFNRNRTRSNASTADQGSERNSLYGSSQPSLTISFPSELSPEGHADGVEMGARQSSWISPGDSTSEFSPASSLLDKDIFDAFPSVPQTLPPGYQLEVDHTSMGRTTSTLPSKGRKQVNPRLSVV